MQTLTPVSGLMRARRRFYTPYAAHLNGTTQYLSHADNTDLRLGGVSWSLALWFKTNSSTNGQRIVSKFPGGGNASGYEIQISPQFNITVIIGMGSNGNTTFTAANRSFTLSTWYFFTLTFDSSTGQLSSRINGGTATTGTQSAAQTNNTLDFAVGLRPPGSGFFSGDLDAIGLWKNRVLSASDITALYNSGKGKNYLALDSTLKTSLVSWWDLDEATGTRNDAHGVNHLTDNGGVTRAAGIAGSA